jgi:6-pyruvoyltetrahydropterin/6-carboxytetrahydropterin synthase
VQSSGLDTLGRVIDFSVIKSRVGEWIDKNWDHNFLVNPLDPLRFINPDLFEGKGLFVMPQGNPTAENLAACLFEICSGLFEPSTGIEVCHVRIYETPNCWADYGTEEFSAEGRNQLRSVSR